MHKGFDKEFAIGDFTAQVGSYKKDLDNEVHVVKPGHKFSIWAYENKSTGYEWLTDVNADGPCKGKLKLVQEKYFVEPSEYMMMGVGGTKYQTYQLDEKAEHSKECTLPFIYARPWEDKLPGWQS